MQTRSIVRWMSLCVAATCAVAVAQGWRRPWPQDPYNSGGCDRRPIDLVICLDTSTSMDGLIDSARAKLWDVVNQLAKARPTPHLRVGLMTYGSPSNSTAPQGWIVWQRDLTDNLDEIYERMMGMRTNGGDEFVGWVLGDAIKKMNWSRDPRALKLIFVAGNESADQASNVINFRSVAEEARAAGISINATYCGAWQTGVHEQWQEVARHGGGDYSAIDMQRGTVQIQTPYDKEILELNLKLNATYVPYGRQGDAGYRRQREQDENAQSFGEQSAGSRVAAKAGPLYVNKDWDLVDAAKESDFKMDGLKKEDLPPAMQSLSEPERVAYVERMAGERGMVQRRIQEINVRRDGFLQEELKKSKSGQAGLDEAMQHSIRKQAEAKGFEF